MVYTWVGFGYLSDIYVLGNPTGFVPNSSVLRITPVMWLDIGDPTSNQSRFEVLQPLHHTPLVINQAQLDWPRQEGFSCKRIEEHKQERINTQSKIADVYKEKIKVGFKNSIPKD